MAQVKLESLMHTSFRFVEPGTRCRSKLPNNRVYRKQLPAMATWLQTIDMARGLVFFTTSEATGDNRPCAIDAISAGHFCFHESIKLDYNNFAARVSLRGLALREQRSPNRSAKAPSPLSNSRREDQSSKATSTKSLPGVFSKNHVDSCIGRQTFSATRTVFGQSWQ